MNVKVDPDLANQVKAICQLNGISYVKYVNNLIEKGLKEDLREHNFVKEDEKARRQERFDCYHQ